MFGLHIGNDGGIPAPPPPVLRWSGLECGGVDGPPFLAVLYADDATLVRVQPSSDDESALAGINIVRIGLLPHLDPVLRGSL